MAKQYFKDQKNGYDKEQVEKYITNMIKVYQKAYVEYLDIYDKYCDLAEKMKKEGQRNTGLRMRRIARS